MKNWIVDNYRKIHLGDLEDYTIEIFTPFFNEKIEEYKFKTSSETNQRMKELVDSNTWFQISVGKKKDKHVIGIYEPSSKNVAE